MKKYFKKGLALMMATLMVMSCWVFFAPEKAEAVNTGNYYVRLVVNTTDNVDVGDSKNLSYTLKYKGNNGKATSESTTTRETSYTWAQNEGSNNLDFGALSGFPTSINVHCRYAWTAAIARNWAVTLTLQVSANGSSYTTVKEQSFNKSGNSFGQTEMDYKMTVDSGSYPKAGSVVMSQPSNVVVPGKSTDSAATTSFTSYLKDQYGVRVSSSATTYSKSVSLSSDIDSLTGISAKYGTTTASNDPCTISVTNSARRPNDDTNKITATASYTFNGVTKTASKVFTVTDPTYKFTFDKNGGSSISPSADVSKYYHNKIFAYQIPSSGVKTGYEFIGMYTTAKTSYDATKPVVGTTSGYTGQLKDGDYMDESRTYYAAWWAKNVTVTLVDNAGNTLKTFTGKYDKAASFLDANWPTEVPFVRSEETGTFDYSFNGHWKVVDAKQFNSSGNQVEYKGVYGSDISSFILKGDTVFQADYDKTKSSYNVKFFGENGNELSNNNYVYKDQPTQPAISKAEDNYFNYTFKGWHLADKDAGANGGYIVNKDGYLSTSATSDEADLVDGQAKYIGIVSDFTVRTDAEYVPVFEKTYNEYTVTFNYKTATGDDTVSNNEAKTYHFGDALNLPTVSASYTKGGYRYMLTDWNKNGAAVGATALPTVLDESVTGKDAKNVTYNAVYGEGIPAEYDITFTYINTDGTEATESMVVKHDGVVTVPIVPATYRDDENEYTFSKWIDQDGAEFSSPAYKDAQYVAQYTAKKLYTVTFMNEGEEFSESAKYVAGDTIIMPAETPAKAADKNAWQYTFENWTDENTNVVTVMPENDLTLYASYAPSYIDYTIKFVWKDIDGNEISDTKTYHYGDRIEIPALDELGQTNYKDDTYEYTFKAWDQDVKKHCAGEGEMSEDGKSAELTYTATYRRVYNYYTVQWMQETGIINGEIQYKDYMTDSFIYNERVRIPTVAPESVQTASDPAYSMVLDHWAYKNADGELVAVDRDTRIKGKMTFYPVYKEAAKVCTVKFYAEDGATLVDTLALAYQTDLSTYAGIGAPKKAYKDDTHFRFNGWVDKATGEAVTIVTDDCELVATYVEEAHVYDAVSADRLPTFFEKGLGEKTCTECGKVVSNVEIDMVPDSVAPSAKLFVKDAVTESGKEVTTDAILVAPKNNLIVATVDSAEKSTYNEKGTGIGTGKIEYFVTEGNTPVDFESISDWKTRFDYDAYVASLKEQGLTDEEIALAMSGFEANATAYVGDLTEEFEDIVKDGKTFIFYAKITDRQGGESGIGGNVCYVRSQPLTYDASAPEINLTGNGNSMSKFCTDVKVDVAEDNKLVSFAVNGEEKEFSADGKTASIALNEKGFYQITATDLAGNVTVKNIEIIGKHNEKSYVTAPTCTEDGTTRTHCTVCGEETKDPIIVDKLGHDFAQIDKVEKTCIEDGYTLYRCSRCGLTEKRDIEKADGEHKFGDPVVSKKATCSAKGEQYYVCSVCGEYKYEDIEEDANAHTWYRGVVTKPTCTKEGYTMHTCKYCGRTEKVEGSTTEPLGHEASGKWVITKPASCEGYDEETKTGGVVGERVQYCVRDGAADCDKLVQVTEPIPVPNHMWKFVRTVDPTTGEDGYNEYKCQNCSAVKHVKTADKLVEHKVTFMVDGEVYQEITKIAGESVTVDDPTKAADKTYKYYFKNWVDENGKKVDLPVAVANDKDIVLTADFTPTVINYTYIFYTKAKTEPFEDVQFKKVGYLKNDDAEPAQEIAGPADYEDEGAYYKFVGWVVKGMAPVFDELDADGNVVVKGNISKSIKISDVTFDAENTAEFEAVFEKTVKKVNVTYAYDITSGKYIYTQELNYGDAVENINTFIPEEIMNTVKKDADDTYHYAFKEWNVREGADALKSVTKNILALAVFTATEHDFKNVEGEGHHKDPTCTEDGYQDTACECGKEFRKVIPALGHTWTETPDENGQVECIVCGEKKDYEASFTVTFYNDNGSTIKRITDIKWNEDISDRIPAGATKQSDERNNYTFSHWYVKGDETQTGVVTNVKADAEYVAAFTASVRTYKVIYRLEGSTQALQVSDVEYGSELPAYTGATPVNDKFDDYQHFVFDDWSKSASDFPNGITGNTVITAVFTREGHQMSNISRKNATCTEPMTEIFKCDHCGYSYSKTSGKALGHKWVLVETVEPTETTEGYELYKCDRDYCNETYKKVLPPKTYIYFTVTVVDQDGNPVQGATVTIFDGTKFVASGTTDAHGKVVFRVEEAKQYRVVVEYNKEHIEGDINVNPDGSTDGGDIGIHVTHCSCTCHRDGIWPAIFRFFHKIIKMIVGHFVCCGDPDPRYNS